MRVFILLASLVSLMVHSEARHNAIDSNKQQEKISSSICDSIPPHELPNECYCRDGDSPQSLIIECLKSFDSVLFNDTIGIKLSIEPCSEDGSSMSLDITDTEFNVDFVISEIKAGEEDYIPIPGLSIAVPQVGHVGVDAVVMINGNPDELNVKVGLDACIKLRGKHVCAEWIPGLTTIFPWWVLSGTYHFGDFCNSTSMTATTVGTSLRASR